VAYRNLIDNASTSVTANTIGAQLDMQYRTTLGRSLLGVPVRLRVWAVNTNAGEAQSVRLLNSAGSTLIEVSITDTGSPRWYVQDGYIPATDAKYDLHFGGATVMPTVYSISLEEYAVISPLSGALRSGSIGEFTLSATATNAGGLVGELSQQIGTFTVTATGTVASGITGSLSASIGDFTLVASASAMGLIALIGDSNAVGQGSTDQADQGFSVLTAHPTVDHHATYATVAADPPTMTTVALQALQPYTVGSSAGLGYEITIGRELSTEGYDPTLVKFAINGTTAAQYATGSTYPSSGGNLMTRLKAYLDARIAQTGKALAAVVISLGTNDASDATAASNYETNLTDIIDELRTTYGSSLVVLIPKVNSGCTNTHTNTVRAAQVSYVAGDALAFLIENDDLSLTDGLHYFASGYLTLGQRIAYKALDAIGHTRRVISTDHPQVVGREVGAFGSGALTPQVWPGAKDGDREVLIVATSRLDNAISLTSAQGFVQVGSTQVSTYTTLKQRVAVFERVVVEGSMVNGRMPSPVVADSNDYNAAMIVTIRGPSGTPTVNASAVGSSNNTYDTSLSLTGVTTTADDCLILMVVSSSTGGGVTISASNGGLTSLTEYHDAYYSIPGEYETIAVVSGVKAAAGATGTTTVTASAAGILAGLTIAYEPVGAPSLLLTSTWDDTDNSVTEDIATTFTITHIPTNFTPNNPVITVTISTGSTTTSPTTASNPDGWTIDAWTNPGGGTQWSTSIYKAGAGPAGTSSIQFSTTPSNAGSLTLDAAAGNTQAVTANADADVLTVNAVSTSPNYQATAAGQGGTGAVTATMPSHQAGDILVVQAESKDSATIATHATPSGWNLIDTEEGEFLGVYARQTLFWKRAASGSETAPTIADNGTENATKIHVIRGCVASGTPYDSTSKSHATAYDGLSVTVSGHSTSGADRLVVLFMGAFTGGAGSIGSWTNGNLASLTERDDTSFTVGSEFVHLAALSGEKTASGAIGNTTATWTASYAVWAGIVVSFKP
jgi:lysophospholipase L1-like esterase